MKTVTIERRFRGPSRSGNGGYVAGLLARHLDGVVSVTLRHPPPLDEPLALGAGPNGQVLLRAGDRIIAEAERGTLGAEVPEAVSLDAAREASLGFPGFTDHPYPECFVCGPTRSPLDGLRIFPGAVDGRPVVAAPWTPDASLADEEGLVRPELVWAALDCPSAFGIFAAERDARGALLGRMTAWAGRRPQTGEACIVLGWSRGSEGRKRYGGAGLYARDGTLLGRSETTWIEPRT